MDCSLRGAVFHARLSGAEGATILLEAGTYTLSLPGSEDENFAGDLDLGGVVRLVGAGRDLTVISGGGIDRVLEVLPGAQVEIVGLTIRDGQAPFEQPGGGVLNRGELKLEDVLVTQNRAGDGFEDPTSWYPAPPGAGGGGIYNLGSLEIKDSQVMENEAGKGSDTAIEDTHEMVSEVAGPGGNGGGILNLGDLRATNTLFENNTAGEGGGGQNCPWFTPPNNYPPDTCAGGDGGSGGAVYNQGYAVLEQVELRENLGGPGGAGGWADRSTSGGAGGAGGGLVNEGLLIMRHFLVDGNSAGEPGPAVMTTYVGYMDPRNPRKRRGDIQHRRL